MLGENLSTILGVCGGLGVFLLGMMVMTENLKLLGGNTMRSALRRFTKNPASGVLTGAVCTAMLQSSSATTVATVGFVRAGLLTFSNALGIILGANIGTTITGWLMALLGFKFSIGAAAGVMVLAGILLRLLRPGKLGDAGLALAGFGLIFIGIDTMQDAMAGLQGNFTPSSFPPDTAWGRLQLCGIGIILILVTQSSSAGVVLTMTALNEGTINFAQSAALIIGINVGTTVTAILAAVGGTPSAKRTALAHVIFNGLTASGALFLITPFVIGWESLFGATLSIKSVVAVAAFHTSFNLLGVLVVLPVAGPFGRLMERIVPEPQAGAIGEPDWTLLDQVELALISARKTLEEEVCAILGHLLNVLSKGAQGEPHALEEIKRSSESLSRFLDDIDMAKAGESDVATMMHTLHTDDHVDRLLNRCEERDRVDRARQDAMFADYREAFTEALPKMLEYANASDWKRAHDLARDLRDTLEARLAAEREAIIQRLSKKSVSYENGTRELEVVRWFARSLDHIDRIMHHLSAAINS